MMIWIIALLCVAVAVGIIVTLQRRSGTTDKKTAPPAYVCPSCGDQDCHCHRADESEPT